MTFLDRVRALPLLGVGLSTEYGAGRTPGALDPLQVRVDRPEDVGFLEIGVEVARGLDAAAERWVGAGHPTTLHFLDLNLDEPEDFDEPWLLALNRLIERMRPAWLCGDAGTWHMGRREPAHMLLLPPILSRESAKRYADGIVRLREATGLEVLPENPPGTAFVGDLHILDFFALVTEYADTGLLLDAAHLSIFQGLQGLEATAGLDDFPIERIVEVHIAGGKERVERGFTFIEDDHGPIPQPGALQILERIAPHAPNLRAVVFECERNGAASVRAGFEQIHGVLAAAPAFRANAAVAGR